MKDASELKQLSSESSKSKEKIFTCTLPQEPVFFFIDHYEWQELRKHQKGTSFKSLQWTNVMAKGIRSVHPYCSFGFKRHRVKSPRARKSTSLFECVGYCRFQYCPVKVTVVVNEEDSLKAAVVFSGGDVLHRSDEVKRRPVRADDRALLARTLQHRNPKSVYQESVQKLPAQVVESGCWDEAPTRSVLKNIAWVQRQQQRLDSKELKSRSDSTNPKQVLPSDHEAFIPESTNHDGSDADPWGDVCKDLVCSNDVGDNNRLLFLENDKSFRSELSEPEEAEPMESLTPDQNEIYENVGSCVDLEASPEKKDASELKRLSSESSKSKEKIFTCTLPQEPVFFFIDHYEWQELRKHQKGTSFKSLQWTNVMAKGIRSVHPYCSFGFKRHRVKSPRARKSTSLFECVGYCRFQYCPVKVTVVVNEEDSLKAAVVFSGGDVLHRSDEVKRRPVRADDRALLARTLQHRNPKSVYQESVQKLPAQVVESGCWDEAPTRSVLKNIAWVQRQQQRLDSKELKSRSDSTNPKQVLPSDHEAFIPESTNHDGSDADPWRDVNKDLEINVCSNDVGDNNRLLFLEKDESSRSELSEPEEAEPMESLTPDQNEIFENVGSCVDLEASPEKKNALELKQLSSESSKSKEKMFTCTLPQEPVFFFINHYEWQELRKHQKGTSFKSLQWTNVMAKGIRSVHPYCSFGFKRHRVKSPRARKSTSLFECVGYCRFQYCPVKVTVVVNEEDSLKAAVVFSGGDVLHRSDEVKRRPVRADDRALLARTLQHRNPKSVYQESVQKLPAQVVKSGCWDEAPTRSVLKNIAWVQRQQQRLDSKELKSRSDSTNLKQVLPSDHEAFIHKSTNHDGSDADPWGDVNNVCSNDVGDNNRLLFLENDKSFRSELSEPEEAEPMESLTPDQNEIYENVGSCVDLEALPEKKDASKLKQLFSESSKSKEKIFTCTLPQEPVFFFIDHYEWQELRKHQKGTSFKSLQWTNVMAKVIRSVHPYCSFGFKRHRVKSPRARKSTSLFECVGYCRFQYCPVKVTVVVNEEDSLKAAVVFSGGDVLHRSDEVKRRPVRADDRALLARTLQHRNPKSVYQESVQKLPAQVVKSGCWDEAPTRSVLKNIAWVQRQQQRLDSKFD